MSQFRTVRQRLAAQRQQCSTRPPVDVMQRLQSIRSDIESRRQQQALEAELKLAEEGDAQAGQDQTEAQP
jgi:hypothetical protein